MIDFVLTSLVVPGASSITLFSISFSNIKDAIGIFNAFVIFFIVSVLGRVLSLFVMVYKEFLGIFVFVLITMRLLLINGSK